MTALAVERNTPRLGDRGFPERYALPIAATTKIYAGSLVCTDASGNAVPGATATTLKAVGRAFKTYDNTAGAAGALTVEVDTGTFKFANSGGGDAIAAADRFKSCYVVDDQTVAKTDGTGTRSIAGFIVDVDSAGVWVAVGQVHS